MCCPKDSPTFPVKITEPTSPAPVEGEAAMGSDSDEEDDDFETEMHDALSQPIYSTGGDIVTIL